MLAAPGPGARGSHGPGPVYMTRQASGRADKEGWTMRTQRTQRGGEGSRRMEPQRAERARRGVAMTVGGSAGAAEHAATDHKRRSSRDDHRARGADERRGTADARA